MATQPGGTTSSSAAVSTPTDPTTKEQIEAEVKDNFKGKDKNKDKNKKAEKERQKALKAEKLTQKQAKAVALQAATALKVESNKKKTEAALPAYIEKTPTGEKKILGDLADAHHAAYHPRAVESAWYAWWEKSGFFQPRFDDAGKKLDPPGAFVIPIPPPNVTGALHCGHALGTALQDVLI